jgi:tetratricopeptide (TPR) repeat protein
VKFKTFKSVLTILLLGGLGLVVLVQGCGSGKESIASKGMQNLTARYNIVYNGRILLDESIRNMESAYTDDYSEVLQVFREPSEALASGEAKNLDSVITKARVIINDKMQSNYVDDAWFLVARANYYKASFFNAAEFLAYLDRNYRQEKALRQEVLALDARALLQLNNLEEARTTLDSALKHIGENDKAAGDVLAVLAQFYIRTGKTAEAIEALQQSLAQKTSRQESIRRTYILAQLLELSGQGQQAYENYTRVLRSNAPFEMAFNADLNRIRIEDKQSGLKVDRIERLRALLKEEKNKEFRDQIYYRIGDLYLERKMTAEALRSYNEAVRAANRNQNQKGLSYLRIAELYFQNGDYVSAKSYYDSTLASLSPAYPNYEQIRKKGSNLDLLASRFRVIGRQDTLQMLARLPEGERDERIGVLVREQVRRAEEIRSGINTPGVMTAAIDAPGNSTAEGKFYFNNTTAIAQGLPDFKRRWGNRQLEDNWRRSAKASDVIQSSAGTQDIPIGTQIQGTGSNLNPETLRQTYLNDLPLTEGKMILSNQQIADSWYDIGSFYRDELKDEREAIRAFEELLRRDPESSYKLPVYYNLYRLYATINPAKSEEYKNLLLQKYPDSPFAKVIQDPSYASRSSEAEARITQDYESTYQRYSDRGYAEVITRVNAAEVQWGKNKLSAQLAYLKALAIGHLNKVDVFEAALRQLVQDYPNDQLVTPLVQQHLKFIADNRDLFATRITALVDHDAAEPLFAEPAVPAQQLPQQPVIARQPDVKQTPAQPDVSQTAKQADPKSVAEKPGKTADTTQVARANVPAVENPATQQPQRPADTIATTFPASNVPEKPIVPGTPAAAEKPRYAMPDSAEYYYVINVLDPAVNLSSSRFGIGQFNRTRYSGYSLRHQLKDTDQNQLIFVGTFANLASVRTYERNFLPLIGEIMKIPAGKYNTFVITKEEFDKLGNRAQIDDYVGFYKSR